MGIVSKLRMENKFTAYHHTARLKIEQYKNLLEWVENTLQEAEEQTISTSYVQTPLAQEKSTKRGREEQSSPKTESSSQVFRIV